MNLAAILAILFAATAAVDDLPKYPCFRIASPPEIDGRLDDAAWKTVPAATGFHRLGGGYTLAKQTLFRLGWDDDALYLGVKCEEPDASLIKPRAKSGDDLWLEDSVEFFIMRPGRNENYQFIVSTSGARTATTDAKHMTDWQAAVSVEEDSWTMELRLPWSTLGTKPASDAPWRGTVCRNINVFESGGDHFTCWAPLKRGFHDTPLYGFFTFREETNPSGEASRIENEINGEYRAHLVERLETVVKEDMRYRDTLARSVHDEVYGPGGRELERTWAQVREVCNRTRNARTQELRAALVNAESLVEETHAHCYNFLIDELIRTP